jgi:hypothetical protein
VVDIYQKQRRLARKKLDGIVETAKGAMSAWAHDRRGDWEAALLDRARLIRQLRSSRESMRAYHDLDRRIRMHPNELETYRVDDPMPKRFILFVGSGRSGHSLVGSLLDAHEHIAISHEMNVLKQFKEGYSYADVVMAAKYNAYLFNHFGRNYTGYDYVVPGQHQGGYTKLEILGDKKGNGTIRLIRKNPELLDRVDEIVPVPLQYVHVIRNPYDNIATRAVRRTVSLRDAYDGYFRNVNTIVDLKKRYPKGVIDVYLDDLMANPHETLTDLLKALGIRSIPQTYLDACASILFKTPRRTRDKFDWEPGLVDDIEARFGEVDFLKRFAAPVEVARRQRDRKRDPGSSSRASRRLAGESEATGVR